MLDSYVECWNRVLLRCPSLSPKLAQDYVTNAFRRLAEMRRWSWLVKFGQFIAPAAYSTGTVTVTQYSTTVVGSGTAWDASLVGRQFRIGLTAPIYTILSVTSATVMDLDSPFGGITQSATGYSIYQCFFPVPQDFHQFITLWDPAFNWQLYLDVQQGEINIWDAQRANTGNAYVVSFRDYTTAQIGIIGPVTLVDLTTQPGAPVFFGTYTGPVNAIFSIECTGSGISGVATYRWKKDQGAYTSATTADTPQSMQDGVQLYWPDGVSYTSGQVWVSACTAISNAGLPRYELWPHQQANHVYPFLYEMRATDLDDPGAVLPRYIRGDVLVDMAMEEICAFPGVSQDKPNPYFSMQNYENYRRVNDRQLQLLEVQDDNVYEQDLGYSYPAIAWAMATPLGDARFLQSHAI